MTRLRSGLAALLGLLILGISGPLWAPPDGAVQAGRATLVGRSFYGSTDIDMVYRIAAANHAGAPVSNLAASVTSTSPNTRILDGGLGYPNREIADGETVDSVDTIRIRQKRSVPFVLSAIAVQFSYDLVTSNAPPAARAGDDQTLPVGATATLDGSASTDPDGDALTYAWSLDEKPAQSAAALSNATRFDPTLPIDKPGSYLLSLMVNDGQLNSAPDQVRIDTVNSAPVAAAGPDASAFINETVLLDGSASSDVDGDQLRFNWSLIERPPQSNALLQSADTDHPSFTLDRAGNYIAELVVNDGVLDSAPDQVVISTENSRPIADAGADQAATLGQPVALDGSASSDPDLDPLGYAWSFTTRPAGSTIAIIDSTLAAASFVPDAVGDYIAQLIVRDAALDSVADTAIVTVTAGVPTNQRPVVNAGADQTITLPAVATLAGTATDDGKPNPPAHLTTTWSLVSGPPSGVVFGSPTTLSTSATFTAPGVYQLRLTASDSLLSQSSDLQVTVSDGAPVLQAIADRTVALGTRYQQLLVASDANVGDTLSYALPTAPTGAALSPSPLIDWTPTAAQLGPNTFTATVADTAGHTATTTFHVTVEHTNHPPQLAPQPNVILPVGTAFSRTLQATDPDAGDTLTFALVSGPAGMTLTGNALTWPTAGIAPGDAAVTVSVTDAGGLTDSKAFTITLTPAAPGPVAEDDSYTARLDETLTIPAPGVLGNDTAYSGHPLFAIKLTDPDKGILNALNADGGFSYTAPATLPPVTGLNPVVSWRKFANNDEFAQAADFNHDGVVDHVSSALGDFRAWRDSDGAQLWQWDRSIKTHADVSGCGTAWDEFALGDVTGGGDIYLFSTINCDQPATGYPDRYFAVNASQILTGGKVATQWKSPRLSQPHPGAYATATSTTLPNPPITPGFAASARGSVPTLAKLTAGGSTKLITRFLARSDYGVYYDTPNSNHQAWAGCRTVTGLPADEGRACKATYVIDAATGAIDQVLTAPNTANQAYTYNNTPTSQNIPIVADLDGDGQVEIISGGDVWKLDGGVWTLAWQAQFASVTSGVKLGFEPTSVAVADLDGDGKAEVIIHIIGYDNGPQKNAGGIHIFNHDGTLRRTIPIPFTWINGLLSVADVDGDGAPEVLLAGDSFVYAYRQDGSLLWAKLLPDITSDVVPPIAPIGGVPRTTDSPLYVYDLNLDGVPEVILQGTRRLFILNGRTGADLWSIDTESERYYMHGNPILVDADDDGHIDILAHVPTHGCANCKGSAMRISGGDHNWAPGPKVQNQLNFRPKATDDTAQILYDASVTRDFRQQLQQGTVTDPRLAQTAAFTYKANDGAADSAPATVAIDIQPANSPPVITSIPPTALFEVSTGFTTIYSITAVDPDVGDAVHYELVSSNFDTTYSPGPKVNAVTGDVDLYSCVGCGARRIVINVAAVDTQGARTEQSFIIDLSRIAVAVPNVIGQLLPAASTAIEAASLKPLVVTELFGPQPAGTVIGQDPLAGTANVGRSATVRLTVSKGPQPFTMPFVVGNQLAPTNALLTGAGLRVNVTTAFSTTIPVGDIMAQAPAAGTELLPGSAPPVALTVSAGGPLPAPIASLVLEPGPGPLLRLAGDEVQYQAVAILTDGTSANVTLIAAWSSSATSTATISPTGIAKAIQAGATTISASLDGQTGQGTLNVAARALGDNTPPTAAITSPADGGAITGPMPIIGTASDAHFLRYELAYALAGEENYTLIAEGTTAVTNGTLGTFDPTVLLNGQYSLRLTVYDRAENVITVERTVVVEGHRKIGLFELSYTDLALPSAGIPVSVTRTYDSRDKSLGDFGVGWRLSVQTLKLQTNRVLGTGWLRTVSGPMVSLSPTAEHRISLTLSDGTVEQFDLQLTPMSSIGALNSTRVTALVPRAGTLGTLEYLGDPDLLVIDAGATTVLVDYFTLDTFDPKLFRYTSIDGQQIEIHRLEGVKKVIDRNGNTVTFGSEGIVHSSGRSIRFIRDGKERITQIIDPKGVANSYAYDSDGNLSSHINATGAASSYKYDRHHNLIEVVDPSGLGGVRSEFDEQGRLTAVIDAAGQRTAFTHIPGAVEEVITDRRGNLMRLHADDDGNIVRQEAAVTVDGTLVTAITSKTYDAQGNETSVIDPDGKRSGGSYDGPLPLTQVIDPAGLNLTTSFVYNAKRDPTRLTDASGQNYDFNYDAAGNLTGATNPLNGTTTSTPNAQGLASERIDALGNRTALSYDAFGRLIREDVFEGAATLLKRTDHAYDSNGNRIRSTLFRTIDGTLTPLATDYGYDAANRLVSVRDPAGGTARIEYDAAGRETSRIDALGRRTTMGYDTLGRLQRTTFPDGSFQTRGYDANGNIVQESDQAGRTTTHAYDELNRRVRTTSADGSVKQLILTPGGQIAASIDPLGQRTDFSYDAAGRLIAWTLPAVLDGISGTSVRPVVTRTLNAAGAPTAVTDPLGRITTFQYDTTGRLAQITFPDGMTQQRGYDALGRLIHLVNEEGQSTDMSYDALGQLVAQSGLGGQASYTYDEGGNLLTQTDALGRVTRFRYDRLGRMIERRYPGGDTETYAYNAVGNLVTRTDANGRVTTLASDGMNRLVLVSPVGAAPISYAYTADGRRASATDTRGTARYSYDARGLLAAVTLPDGASLTYGYDANGNVTSLATPAATIGYSYDALNRMTTVTAPEGTTTDAFDLGGNRVRRTAANGIRTDKTFDLRNRPTLIAHKNASDAVLASFANTYSGAGRRLRTVEASGAAEDFGYDSMGRLTSHTRTGANAFAHTYAYDALGNRTQQVRNGAPTIYSYDVNDRLLTEGGNSYAYDANGNLTSRSNGASTTHFGYDAFNRMVTVASPAGMTQYEYDADGGLVSIDRTSGVTRQLVAHQNPSGLSQIIEERDGANVLTARYTVAREALAAARGGASAFYLRDALGSVRGLANGSANLTDSYQFDGYGNQTSSTGSTINPLRFAGEHLDAESGFYQLRARQLDSTVGRFTTRDPFSGRQTRPSSLHRYQYADGDPVNNTDPTGQSTLAEQMVTFALNNFMEGLNLIKKGRAICQAYGKVRQARVASGLLHIATAGLMMQDLTFSETSNGKVAWGGSGGQQLFKADFGDLGSAGSLKTFELKAVGEGGKAGLQMALELKGRPIPLEVQAVGPPLEVKFSGGITGLKEPLAKFGGCGGETGELLLESSLKVGTSVGNDAAGSVVLAAGVAVSLDLKAELFSGAFSYGFPLIAVETGTGGTKVTWMGFSLAFGGD